MAQLRINARVSIPLSEIELRTSTSSGPGGQHTNRTQSRVEAVFAPLASTALSDAQRERIVKRLGPRVSAVAQDQRSQLRNRELALERLADKLAGALRVRPSRTATRPSQAARERRLAAKRRRAEVKAARRPPRDADTG